MPRQCPDYFGDCGRDAGEEVCAALTYTTLALLTAATAAAAGVSHGLLTIELSPLRRVALSENQLTRSENCLAEFCYTSR